MFDIGWQELFILAVLAIIVVGPKDLPRVIGTITKWIRKARSMARDLQDGLDDVAREAELDDLKKELAIQDGGDIVKRIGDSVDPTGELTKEMDLEKDVYDEMTQAADDLSTSTAPTAPTAPEKKAPPEKKASPEKNADDTKNTKKSGG